MYKEGQERAELLGDKGIFIKGKPAILSISTRCSCCPLE